MSDDRRFIAACHAMQAIIAKSELLDLRGECGDGRAADEVEFDDALHAVVEGAVGYADALLARLDEEEDE